MSILTRSRNQLWADFLANLGGSGSALTMSEAELIAAARNTYGGDSVSALTTARVELIESLVNAAGGSVSSETDNEDEMMAALATALGASGWSSSTKSSLQSLAEAVTLAAWVPLADSTGNALVDLDFENSRFHFNGTTYTSFAALLTAIGGGSDGGTNLKTLGPVSNLPFAGYTASAGTVVSEYTKSGASQAFVWTIQQSGDNLKYWRRMAQNGSTQREMVVLRNNVLQASITQAGAAAGTRLRYCDVMTLNDFAVYSNGAIVGTDTSGDVSDAATNVAAMIGHRAGLLTLDGTLHRWAYFPRAVAAEDRQPLSLRSTDLIIGARTFFNSPSLAVVGGNTYAMQISNAGVVGPRREGKGVVVLKTGMEIDDHNEGAILRRSSDGRYIAHYCNHSIDNNFYQKISTNPDDVTSWGSESNLGASLGATNYTYSNMVEVTDGIFDFTRAIAPASFLTFGYTKSTDNGANWAAFVRLFDETDHRSYLRVSKRAANQIDIICNDGHPDEFTVNQNSTYHFYYDAGTWRDSAGTGLGAPPFRPQTVLTKVWDAVAQGKSSWVWDVAPGPVCVFATFTAGSVSNSHQYQYGKWNGSAWVVNQICTAGGTLYPIGDNTQNYYSGGICIDPDDVNTIYCSRETGTGGPHRNSGWFQIWKGVTADSGATWALTQLTSEARDHFRPKKAASGQLTYMRTRPSTNLYTSYTQFGTEMVFMDV